VENLKRGIDKVLKNEPIKKIKSGNPKEDNALRVRKEVKIEIIEVKNPWTSAALVSQWVAQQTEKRLPFRGVLKRTIAKVMANKEVQGVKIEISGRLNGAEIARREWLKQGRLPLQTIRSDIDFAKAEALCAYGIIGIKVWLYKGEKFE
jgi:small subunit ribosomal protein S3